MHPVKDIQFIHILVRSTGGDKSSYLLLGTSLVLYSWKLSNIPPAGPLLRRLDSDSFLCVWGASSDRGMFASDLCLFRQPCRGREGFHPPGAYFSHAGKVGKRALRGFAPKDPKFLDQGRGEVYFRNDVGSGITYGPRHSPVVRLSACETVPH